MQKLSLINPKSIMTLLVALIWLVGCSGDIEKVKNAKFPGETLTIGESLNLIAGVSGKVEWRSFKPESGNFKVVEAVVRKGSREALIQYKLNPNTGVVEVGYIEVDGEPQSILSGVLALSSLAFDK
jgi:hypothetical protein